MKQNFFYHLAALNTVFNMKKTVLAVAITMLSLSAAATPSDPLIRLFSRTFPDAKYIRWTEEREYYLVTFTQNDTRCMIWYDKEDTFVYSLRYCQENELPLHVLLAVKKRYHDKHIDGVTEITTQHDVTYTLILSDNKKLSVVDVTALGEISPKYSFQKQQ
jgi:hypothetical protein